jgi:hypothetical protein
MQFCLFKHRISGKIYNKIVVKIVIITRAYMRQADREPRLGRIEYFVAEFLSLLFMPSM